MNNTVIKELVYVNNAATTWPKPESVLREASVAARGPYSEHGRTTLSDIPDYLYDTRVSLADLFHIPDPDQFVFTANATDALNLLIHGFCASQNKRFSAVTTLFEHNSVIRPLLHEQEAGILSLSRIPPDRSGMILPEAVQEAITPDTRLGLVSHAGNVIGTIQNIEEICHIFSEQDIFTIIDGAQSAGQVPVDLSRIPCDAFVFTGHKYLFGVPGTGGFFLRTPEPIIPIRQGGTGMDSRSPVQPSEMPHRFEAGTPNFIGIASLQAGIEFIRDTGQETITRNTLQMIRFILGRLQDIDEIRLLHSDPMTPILSFQVPGTDPDDIGFMLAKAYGIITRSGLHCAPWIHDHLTGGEGTVRISLSCFNTMDQCKTVCDAIEEICCKKQDDI
ncbi:MAG: aminotransferase class V-fold PLP-dependent enzyme [Methanospirillaceae archaeon]|nr:aminotransferase class V-fold PLP-dependent enzyme [Methanospirillaceae archaeon]